MTIFGQNTDYENWPTDTLEKLLDQLTRNGQPGPDGQRIQLEVREVLRLRKATRSISSSHRSYLTSE
jgi:hypothetical protein